MSDMLSQEEIDALLRGDSAAPQPDSSSQIEALSDEEKDALGEIGNISMGTSATTLYTLLNQKVSITTPKVTVLSWEELAGQYPIPYVAVQVEYKEGLVGSNLLILKEDDVKIITDLMMGGSGQTNAEPITELHLSAISEAMNQMIGSSSTSLAGMFNKRIDISPPKAFSMLFNDPSVMRNFAPEDIVVKISFRMEIGDIIDSEIMQLLPIDFARTLVNNLYNSMEPQYEAPKTTAAKPAVEPVAIPKVQPQAKPIQNELSFDRQPAYQEPMRTQAPAKEESKIVNVQPIQYQSFDDSQYANEKESISIIRDIPLEVTVELGRTKKLIRDILEFGPGTILELDKLAGEPVDILVNGKYIAKGEVVVIDESFGVRITDIISASKRLTKI
ncbi:MAG: flagellar motor switch protein FliN [Clostridia bacterium]|jgi:flagellar motor switch protein FliN/FliY|nr:flagellar motor switch protein FliN [Clostridia bacterium]